MRALLARGATLEAATSKGCRAVHMAAMKGCAPALRELASMGAELNAADLRGYTPLHWAAVKGHAATLEVRGRRCRWRREGNRCDDRKRLLPRPALSRQEYSAGGRVHARPTGLPHLWGAASCRKGAYLLTDFVVTRRAQTLAELGVDLERKDTSGLTALFWAAKKGQDGALRTLVHLGAAVDGRDANRRTALWPLAEKGQVAAVRMLCTQGCHVNALDAKGASVAHAAAAKNQVRRSSVCVRAAFPV